MEDELFDVQRDIGHMPPDGKFEGEWHGYQVKFNAFGADFIAKTNNGIRGWAKCIVTVADGKCVVKI